MWVRIMQKSRTKLKRPVWHKRFKNRINPEVAQFMDSTKDDESLIHYEIQCSIAHSGMLKKQGIINKQEFTKIKNGLNKILNDCKKGKFKLSPELEDVHMNIEFQLKKEIGETAERLHTARSRNDLIATELGLYCRDAIKEVLEGIIDLQRTILGQAQRYKNVIIPGYTHLQQAQPMLVSFYLSSFFYKFQRDFEQLIELRKRINVSPLGSCAFAGTGIDIDRQYLARKLGFEKPCENALDGISDRDFLIDFLYYLTRIMLHISTLAEDLIIFSTNEFGIVELDDTLVTGSSIMPHKRNPDVCEILRAKSARAIGSLVSGLTILKGLPSSYNRDLQEIKSVLLNQVKETDDCLKTTRILVGNCKFKTPGDDWVKKPNFMCAVDLIDFFVKKGRRFREIYGIIGECIRESKGDMKRFIQLVSKKTKIADNLIEKILTPVFSIKNKCSEGGTGPSAVEKTIRKMETNIRNNIVRLNRNNA